MKNRPGSFLKRFSTGKRLFVLLLSVLIVLTGVSVPVYAWITYNRVVKKKTEMQIDGNMVMATQFTPYTYNMEEGHALIPANDDIHLPLFDTVFTEKNDECTLVFRAPVFGDAIRAGNDFTVTLSIVDHSDVTGRHDNNYLDGDKTDGLSSTAIADYLSNIILVRCAAIPDEALQKTVIEPEGDATEADFVYSRVHSYFHNSENEFEEHSFVTVSGGQATKADSITFHVGDYDSFLSDEGILFVYLEISYNEALISQMIETRSLSFDIEDVTVHIDSDLDLFEFSVTDNGDSD